MTVSGTVPSAFSTRCPRQNNPGGIITIMREVAVNHGMQSAKDALKVYSRIIYKIMSTGTQAAPDMLQPDFFPDWGPDVKQVSDNLDVWRRCVPPETMHTTELAWDVSEKTRLELLYDMEAHRQPGNDRKN